MNVNWNKESFYGGAPYPGSPLPKEVDMKVHTNIAIGLITLLIMFTLPSTSKAQPVPPGCPGWYEGAAPYGRHCPGMGRGPYGARRVIKTPDEAKQAIEQYFSGSGKAIEVGKVEERRWFFKADILGPDNTLIDILIIDRRTGRIRSIY
ncbi:MAG: hypothetical protein C0392_11890 [Syntrophus sp. (in: bacteria)]|nr:hypothetical protein [Syntrophus sp. (in: bacteria)]